MKKYYGFVIWALLMGLTLFLTLTIPKTYSPQIWSAVIFDVLAFVLLLIIGGINKKSKKEVFYKIPLMYIGGIYVIAQVVISIVVAVINTILPMRVLLIIEVIILIVSWIVIMLLIMSKDEIEELDKRQKDHHVEL